MVVAAQIVVLGGGTGGTLTANRVRRELALPRSHEAIDAREPERDEEQARLVHVVVVAVDDVDLDLVVGQPAS